MNRSGIRRGNRGKIWKGRREREEIKMLKGREKKRKLQQRRVKRQGECRVAVGGESAGEENKGKSCEQQYGSQTKEMGKRNGRGRGRRRR